jgi:hypothetical protein
MLTIVILCSIMEAGYGRSRTIRGKYINIDITQVDAVSL